MYAVINAFHIDGKHSVPFFLGDIAEHYLLGDARVIDEGAYSAEVRVGESYHFIDCFSVSDIGAERECSSAEFGNFLADFLGFFL